MGSEASTTPGEYLHLKKVMPTLTRYHTSPVLHGSHPWHSTTPAQCCITQVTDVDFLSSLTASVQSLRSTLAPATATPPSFLGTGRPRHSRLSEDCSRTPTCQVSKFKAAQKRLCYHSSSCSIQKLNCHPVTKQEMPKESEARVKQVSAGLHSQLHALSQRWKRSNIHHQMNRNKMWPTQWNIIWPPIEDTLPHVTT